MHVFTCGAILHATRSAVPRGDRPYGWVFKVGSGCCTGFCRERVWAIERKEMETGVVVVGNEDDCSMNCSLLADTGKCRECAMVGWGGGGR